MNINELSSWGLSKAINDVIEQGFSMDEETGEVFFTDEDLEKLQLKLEDKMNAICGYIKKAEANSAALTQRKKEIDENIKYYDKRVEKLKDFMLMLMESKGISKMELADYRIGTRRTPSLNIKSEEMLLQFLYEHPEYKEGCQKTETKTSIIKNGVKELIKKEEIEVPGVEIVENKTLSIK